MEANNSHDSSQTAPPTTLDKAAAEAIKTLRSNRKVIYGPIRVRKLWRNAPLRGKNRNWTTAVEILLLEDIIDAYRWSEGKWPKWSLWPLLRQSKAKEYGVSTKTISRCLGHLKKKGLIGIHLTTLINDESVVYGRKLWVWPKVAEILKLMERIPEEAEPMRPDSGDEGYEPKGLSSVPQGSESSPPRLDQVQSPKGAKVVSYSPTTSSQGRSPTTDTTPELSRPLSPSARQGASPPDPHEGAKPPRPPKGPSARLPSSDTNEPVNPEVKRLLEGFQLIGKALGRHLEDDPVTAAALLTECPSDTPVEALWLIRAHALSRIGQTARNGYDYKWCLNSEKLQKFRKHLPEMQQKDLRDEELDWKSLSGWYPEDLVNELVKFICVETWEDAKLHLNKAQFEELHQMLRPSGATAVNGNAAGKAEEQVELQKDFKLAPSTKRDIITEHKDDVPATEIAEFFNLPLEVIEQVVAEHQAAAANNNNGEVAAVATAAGNGESAEKEDMTPPPPLNLPRRRIPV
jgi:hypothetical protein